MSANTIDLISLLESPCEEFLPRAFREVIGREPDIGGLLHYIERLKKGLPRELILAEMRHSAEGQDRAFFAKSSELDALHARYLKLRGLPLGDARWKLLPSLTQTRHDDVRFDWTEWVNAFTDRQEAQKVEHLYEQQQQASFNYSSRSLEISQKSLDELLYLSGEHLIREAFEKLLNRQPDEVTLSYYLRCLSNGYGKVSIVYELATSAEHIYNENLSNAGERLFKLMPRNLIEEMIRGGLMFSDILGELDVKVDEIMNNKIISDESQQGSACKVREFQVGSEYRTPLEKYVD
ncbi:MAG: DUF4214 domain-containing protein [Acidithiobacillus sp.]|nr:DUF4214 domain-containing protein [Acidithiobacillus sp.]